MEKSADAYRTISEVAEDLKLPQHVLRFWETRFPQIQPMKRGGGRRFYSPADIELLRAIRTLLYGDGYTIKGVQRILKEQGPRAVASLAQSGSVDAPVHQDEPAEAQMRGQPGPGQGKPGEAAFGFDREGDMVFSDFESPPPADRAEGSGSAPSEPGIFGPEGPQARDAIIDRLQAILFELSECERILGAVRD